MTSAALAKWLLAVALSLPRSHAPDETRDAELERLKILASSMAEAAVPYADGRGWTASELALAGLIIWHGETLLDERPHAGKPHPEWTQDNGLATCGMQLHTSKLVPPELWATLAGADEEATLRCARAGLLVLVAQARTCGVWRGRRADRDAVAKAMAAYATGGHCAPTEREWQRANRWQDLIARRPDRPARSLEGFHRVPQGGVPPELSTLELMHELLEGEVKSGFVRFEQARGRQYALVVEPHAGGKTGISVFVEDAAASPASP
jgi:hypothetical protein